ncbi:MAG: right-handed parallel beta-helix repeat-containing protein, partial [Methylobacterium sp.]|nr:right-handed parallel beta-helix repeat-containing protein [Methylobacterium sp.]
CLVVAPGESIQDAIDALPAVGGCICLKAGLHVIERPLHIKTDNVTLHGESLGALVSMRRAEPILVAEKMRGLRLQQISFRAEQGAKTAALLLLDCRNSAITDCTLTLEKEEEESIGLHAVSSAGLNLDALRVGGFSLGLWFDEDTSDVAVERCQIHLPKRASDKMTLIGLLATHGHGALRVDNNTVLGAHSGIVLNDTPGEIPASRLIAPLIRGNTLELLRNPGKMGRTFGIDCAAPGALVEGNALGHEGGTFTAIRLTGDAATARDNLIVSRARQLGLTLAIGVGDTLKKIPVPVADVTLAGNRIFGLQHGILAQWVSKGVVEANLLGTIEALQGAGVTLVSCADTLVRANEIGAALFGVSSMRGARNRFEANVINAGDAGIAVLQELAPTIAGNRITGCTLGGIALVIAAGRCESVSNRIVNCGAEGKPGVGIGALTVLGEWDVEGNEVMDTGLPVEKGGPEAALAYGVAGAMVLEARVSNNLITYSDILRRPVTSEDRALLLMGYLDMQLDDKLTFGFPVNIAGNTFLGASATHLVELVEQAFSPQVAMRFERVFFSGNDCVHLCPKPNDKSATVSLVGRVCTVSANQVKPTSKGYRSFDFHGMPGPYMGNVTGGDTLGRPAAQEFPAPQSAYNMIF